MVREVSDKVIIVLLFFAILSSILGTYFAYEHVNEIKQERMNKPMFDDSSSGYVTLKVAEGVNNYEEV
jgi:hypothetical protein